MLRNSNGQNGDITTGILNEVLSLNAQELTTIALPVSKPSVLNEVLSLNAQECPCRAGWREIRVSSMKS